MKVVEKIANDLKLNTSYICCILSRANFYYKDYTIPKKNGDLRHISQASPELKTLQYWIIENILTKFTVSKAAFAYKKGDSIKRHAEYHKESNYIFHTDIHDFFLNIHSNMLEAIIKEDFQNLKDTGFDLDDVIEIINRICFRSDRLCIGTVSSPSISNIVMFRFDQNMIEYCKSKNMRFSRYADDIYISSNSYIENTIINYIVDQLQQYNFVINKSKTWFCSSKNRRKVTGLIITNDHNTTIGIKRRNEIKKMVYDKLIHKKGDSNQILGYLSFLKDVEPQTYNNIIVKYSQYCDGDIIDAINK